MKHVDLTYLQWSIKKNSSGTAGTFFKSFYNGKYYKLSNFDAYTGKFLGHESINEYVVDRFLNIQNINHLSYELVNADIMYDNKKYNTYLCISDEFKEKGESKKAIDVFYKVYKNENESPLQMIRRMGFSDNIDEMFLVDFLICNRDRHGANVEIIKKGNKYRLSPLFDHGLSLFFNVTDFNKLKNEDLLEDKRIQCFFGTNSSFENLKLMKKHPKVKLLDDIDKEYIFSELKGIMPDIWIDTVFNLFNTRIKYYENTFNKK